MACRIGYLAKCCQQLNAVKSIFDVVSGFESFRKRATPFSNLTNALKIYNYINVLNFEGVKKCLGLLSCNCGFAKQF